MNLYTDKTVASGGKRENILLTPRLRAVADFIAGTGEKRIADIGTDHAKLPIYLIQNGICDFVYAADLRAGPLNTAEKNLSYYGIGKDRVKTVLSDGLDNIPDDCGCSVIAGMGGLVIADIIRRADRKTVYIASPMSSAEDLRRFFYTEGYVIDDESAVCEERRFYPVMKVHKGEAETEFTDFDCYFSLPLQKKYGRDTVTDSYFQHIYRIIRKAVDGQKNSVKKKDNYMQIKALADKTEAFILAQGGTICQ